MSGFATTSSVWTNVTKNLWDKTNVIGTTWKDLKEEAMAFGYKESKAYCDLNALDRDLIDELIAAQIN